jgi:hypothetical protein
MQRNEFHMVARLLHTLCLLLHDVSQVATFSVHAHSPYTVAQPLYEPLPVRLACSGYNGTVFALLPFPEDEIAHAAVEQAVQVITYFFKK